MYTYEKTTKVEPFYEQTLCEKLQEQNVDALMESTYVLELLQSLDHATARHDTCITATFPEDVEKALVWYLKSEGLTVTRSVEIRQYVITWI